MTALDAASGAGTARRIFVLTPGFSGADGIAAVSRSVLTALGQTRSVVLQLASLADTEPWEGPGPIEEQTLASGSRLRLIRQALRSTLARTQPDLALILHLHLAPLAIPYLFRGTRCAVFLHGIEAWQPLRRRENSVLKRSRLLANSQWTVGQFRKANPTLASVPVTVTHLGITEHPPEPHPCSRLEGRFALTVGRMHAGERYKGHDALLDLWPRILQQVPDARLVIAGDGNDRQRLQVRAEALGLSPFVHFTGRIPDGHLAWLYQNCCFFAMPSRGEGFGLVFLEAMRAGKACLGGQGAAEEVIVDGETGRIVDPNRLDDLEAALVELFLDPATTAAMGRAGRERFLACFTREQFAERLRRALDLE